MGNDVPSVAVLYAEVRALCTQFETAREADAQLLKYQTEEYNRRLENLNHAHAAADKRDAQYVPRETHSKDIALLAAQITGILRIVYVGVGIGMAAQVAVSIFLLLKH
jgi:hypothetical protein